MKVNRETSASFDVDPQNGFTPRCPDELPVPGGSEIVDALNTQATFARLRVVSKDAHPANAVWAAGEQGEAFSEVEGENVDIRWQMHCVPGTKGFELIDGLPAITDYDFTVFKGVEPDMHPYGACYHDLNDQISTGVIEYLKHNDIDTVICGGLATDYCVKLTALQLRNAGFTVIVNMEACRGIAEDTVRIAKEELIRAGVFIINDTTELDVV